MKKIIALISITALFGFLFFWPTDVEPLAWQPAKAPSLKAGIYAENSLLANIKPVGSQNLHGPEALVIDDDGFLITGLHDGRIVRTSIDGYAVKELVNTQGRPLGLAWHPDGRLIIADAIRGLLALDLSNNFLTVLAAADGENRLGFTDDLDISSDGRYAYFSDATLRWGYGQDGEAIMEHGGDGRLLRYDFSNGQLETLLDGLEFANGVALGPNDEYVLVNETGAYRVTRYWLNGDKAGQHDIFIDNLPGFPDNIRFDGNDRFWLALYAPRNILVDGLAPYPFWRKVLVRAMLVLPKPIEKRSFAVALNTQGEVVANLQHAGRSSYAPITTVLAHDNWLYFGSLTQNGMARIEQP